MLFHLSRENRVEYLRTRKLEIARRRQPAKRIIEEVCEFDYFQTLDSDPLAEIEVRVTAKSSSTC